MTADRAVGGTRENHNHDDREQVREKRPRST